MIFFFSGTGNSEYLAKVIAEKTDDKVVSITKATRNNEYCYKINEGENIGFVMPVYFYGIPSAVLDFIDKMKISAKGNNYVYSALNCGGTTADAGKMLQKALKKHRLTIDGYYAVKMVDNYIPMYNISDNETAKKELSEAEPLIQKIAKQIVNKEKGDFNTIKGPAFMTKVLYPLYKSSAKTKKFFVEDNCTGCGKCSKECVCNAIEIKSGKPEWTKPNCTQCLHCIHICPVRAIQFGEKTKERNRYYNPNV